MDGFDDHGYDDGDGYDYDDEDAFGGEDGGYGGGAAGRAEVVISSPEELIASVPSMVGFTPAAGSVVVVCGRTADGGPGPVARLDAHGLLGTGPGDPGDEPGVGEGSGVAGAVDEGPARGMAGFCAREGVREVHLLVVHEGCADDPAAERRAADAVDAFAFWLGMAGTEVRGAYGVGGFARGSGWVDLCGMARGVQTDPDSCEIAAVYAYGGRVRATSREEIEELYRERDEDACDEDTSPRRPARARRGRGVARAVDRHDAAALRAATGTDPADDVLAEVGASLRDVAVRDAVYGRLADEDLVEEDGRRRLWWAIARRRPAPERSVALLLLGSAAYFTGSGVHARAALTEAVEADPGNGLAGLLLHGLDHGIPPERIRRAAVA